MLALAATVLPLLGFFDEPSPALPPISATVLSLARGALLGTVVFVAVDRRWRKAAIVVVGVLLAFIQFDATFGLRLIDPHEVGWVMHGKDGRWHHTSWVVFRHEPWHLPPGKIVNLTYPVGTSIANTDSVPLPAFLLKPFDPWLSPDFQYFGLWFLLSALLRGVFAALIAIQLGAAWPVQLLALALVLWGPGSAVSMDHAGRAGMPWLTLAALWLYFRPRRASAWSESWPWLALVGLSASMNPYLCASTVALYAAALLRRWWPERAVSAPGTLRRFAAALALVLTCWWLAGYFELRDLSQMKGGELGLWSMDLLSFVNPDYPSSYLPTWPIGPGQIEGAHYLGAGILLLVGWCLVLVVARRPTPATVQRLLPLMLACAVLLAAALSPKITAMGRVVLELPQWLYAPVQPFRASGRFGGPVAIAIAVVALRFLVSRHRAWIAAPLLLVCFLLQVDDRAFPGELSHRRFADANHYVWAEALSWEAWEPLTRGRREIRVVPETSWSMDERFPFAYLAARTGLASADGDPARRDSRAEAEAGAARRRELEQGIVRADVLYVLHPADVAAFRRLGDMTCRAIDGYEGCVVRGTGESRAAGALEFAAPLSYAGGHL